MADSAVKPIPEGYHSLTPSLTVRGAVDAIAFYARAFGAREISRALAPDGKRLWHAELQIGDSRMMLTDEMPEQGSYAPPPTGAVGLSIWLYVEDVDAVYQRAIDAGAKAQMAPADTFWGDRFGGLQDPFGHNWAIATRKENLTEEEMRRRADEFIAQTSGRQSG
jgi:PhnB protein